MVGARYDYGPFTARVGVSASQPKHENSRLFSWHRCKSFMSLGYMCPYAEMDISLKPEDWLELFLALPEVPDATSPDVGIGQPVYDFWEDYFKDVRAEKVKKEEEPFYDGPTIPNPLEKPLGKVKERIIEEAKKRIKVLIDAPPDPVPVTPIPRPPNINWQPNHISVPVVIPRPVLNPSPSLAYPMSEVQPSLSFSEVLAPTTIPIMLEDVGHVPVPSAGMLPLSSLTPTVSYPMGMALLGDALRNAESASLSEKSVRESLTPLDGDTTSAHTSWTSDEYVMNQVGVQASMIDGVKKHITEKVMEVADALDLKPYHLFAATAIGSAAGGVATKNPAAFRAAAAAGSAAVASFASRNQTTEASTGLADYGSAGLPYI